MTTIKREEIIGPPKLARAEDVFVLRQYVAADKY
jgi:hypothetical protein